ncbi:MAG: hypothetical protein AB1696_26020, partial [Planctomycetota bacterium]
MVYEFVYADLIAENLGANETKEEYPGDFVLTEHVLRLTLKDAGDGLTGHYVLNFAGDTFRVYLDDPRGLPEGSEPPAVESGVTEFDANGDTTVYVKGIAADRAMCTGRTVALSYVPGERPVSTAEGSRTGDIVKINVSEIQIEVNNTPDDENDPESDDDFVGVGAAVPTRLRIFPWWPDDITLTVDSAGEGKLEFSQDGATFADTLPLTFSKVGLWSHIYVSTKEGPEDNPGAYTNAEANDTYITVHASETKKKEDVNGFTLEIRPLMAGTSEYRPAQIMADTDWEGSAYLPYDTLNEMQKAEIKVIAKSPGYESWLRGKLDLKVKEMKEGYTTLGVTSGYKPTSEGYFSQSQEKPSIWEYTPFEEPRSEKHPQPMVVSIVATAPVRGMDVEVSNTVKVVVMPVFCLATSFKWNFFGDFVGDFCRSTSPFLFLFVAQGTLRTANEER